MLLMYVVMSGSGGGGGGSTPPTITVLGGMHVIRYIPPASLPGGTVVARFIAGNGETFTGDRLTQWNDQSGNGYHATGGSTTSPLRSTAANARVAWDNAKGRPVIAGWNPSLGYMTLSSSQSTSLRNFSALMVVRRNNSAVHQANDVLTGGIAIGFDSSNMVWTNSVKPQFWSGGASAASPLEWPTPISPHVIGIRGHSAGTDFVTGTRIIRTATILPNLSFTGGFLGQGISPSFGFKHELYESVFLSDCSESQFIEWANYLQAKWDGNGSIASGTGLKNRTIVFVGDSTAGGEPWYTSSPIIAEQIAGRRPNIHIASAAINSMTVGTTGGNHVDQQIAYHKGLFDSTLASGESAHPYVNRICVIMGGTNDIYFGSSAATVKAALTARVSQAKALGATHVAICTIMDATRNDAGMTAVRSTVNADIKNLASGIGHDVVINLHETANGGDDRFNNAAANSGGVFIDNVHPSYYGSTVLSSIIENQISHLL